MTDNPIKANIPTPDRIIRRAASVDDDSFYVGREKYQQHQLLPNRLMFGLPSPSIHCSKDSTAYGLNGAAVSNGNGGVVNPPDVTEMRTESSTHVERQVVPQDRLFLDNDNNEQMIATATTESALIFRRSPTTKTVEQLPPLHFQQQQQHQQPQSSEEATPVNFLVSSSPLGTFSIPGIRPSLSCPTAVFDSPLLPRGAATNQQRQQQHIMPCPSNSSAAGDELADVNVSAIAYCDDEDEDQNVTPSEDDGGEEINTATITNPMRNLSDAFELLVAGEDGVPKKQLQRPKQETSASVCDVTFEDKSAATTSTSSTSTKPSPTSVLGFDPVDSSSPPAPKKGDSIQLENGITVLRTSLPRFHLHEDLRGEMSQGLIDRVSFYSIVRDINKEATDAAMTDPKGHLYNNGRTSNNRKAGGKEVVRAKDGTVHAHPIQSKESNNILVLAGNTDGGESDLAPDMGAALLDEEWWLLSAMASRSPEEVALNHASALPSTFSEALGEKDNSTADVSSSSKTQLWKPGRSWWEAKSGKNPWVEPVVHNNRWRYLWPLIHYHKFLAKSIRKLRRNGIDVKTSTSSLSLFLRQEVCNVSDHLAFVSKYDSVEWTNALRYFEGWTDHNRHVEESVRSLVLEHKLQGIHEMSDIESSLLRSQINDAILKAMKSEKEKVAQDAYSKVDGPVSGKRNPIHDSNNGNWKRPPVHNKTPNKTTAANRNARWMSAGYNAPYPHQGMMHGQRFHQPHHHYAPSSYGHHNYHNNQYNGYDHYSSHHHYAGAQYPVDHYGHQQYYQNFQMDGGFSEASSFDGSAHVSEASVPFIHPNQTPTRFDAGNVTHGQHPASPYWNHLNLSQLPGLSSPSCQLSPAPSFHTHQSQTDNSSIDGKAKSLIMFHKQTNSPASRFTMSPQDESHPYYTAKNTVLPTIEGYSADTPQKQSEGLNESIEMPPEVKKVL